MSSLLRRSHLPVPVARFYLTGAYRTRTRYAAVTPFHRSWAATHRIRGFASKPPPAPQEPKHEKDKAAKDGDAKKTTPIKGESSESKPGAAAPEDSKGASHSPSEPPPTKKDDYFTANASRSPPDETPKNVTKLTEEEEQSLDRILKQARRGMPKTMVEDLERAFDQIKQVGATKETRDLLHELRSDEPMSIAKATRIMRLASVFAMQQAEMETARKEKGEPRQEQNDAKEQKDKSRDEFREEKKEDESKQKSKQEQGQPKLPELKFDTGSMVTAALTAYLLYRLLVPSENSREITWQEFRTSFLDKGLVEKLVVVNSSRVKVFVHREAVKTMHPDSPAIHPNFFYVFTIGSVEAFERKLEEAQSSLGIPSSEQIPVSYSNEISWGTTLLSFAPVLIITATVVWMARRGGGGNGRSNGIFGMGRSRAKRFNHETDIQMRFKDVAGMDEAKLEIMEFVSFLKEPGEFQRLGAKIPRGAILSGPPGTGKTLLAKATAGESQVPFFSVSGSEFVEMFVGVGASRVRDLFENARKNTPCIIFIDEIDAIGKSRAKQTYGGGNDEREATLNQILTEMDGFNTSEQVVVLAGTNRPDVLDSALMRPGRFDRHISIDRPTMEGRKQIFAVHLRKIVTDENMDHLTGRLSALTPGFSGADIANACNEAALIAARAKADKVRMLHFEQAIERTIGGLEKKSLVLNEEEKRTVAYHEAGHAICGWFLEHADPLLKVSIIPRGQGALGYAQYLPPGDRYLMKTTQFLDRMAMTLGGRVSEQLHFEAVTSGGSDDFKKVTRMATAMVTKYGMSDRVGTLYFDEEQQQFQKPFSEATAQAIDAEVRRLVDEAYARCKELLTAKKREVGMVAEELLKLEVLTRDDMVRLLGKRPFGDNKDFERYFGGGSMTTPPEGSKSAPPPPPNEGGSIALSAGSDSAAPRL